MYLILAGLLLAQPPDAAPAHEAANPLYKELVDPGLIIGPDIRAKLPAPVMADGLDGAAQTEVIKKLIGTDYSYAEFTRNSAVAPYLLKLRNITPSDPKAPARGVDIYFLLHGNLDDLDDEGFRKRLLGSDRGKGKGRELTAEELAKRKIVPAPELEKRERYGVVELDFLEKVRINATGRSVWSKTASSVLAAGAIDSRFPQGCGFSQPVAGALQRCCRSDRRPCQSLGWSGLLP